MQKNYSRENPSPRYTELLSFYEEMHKIQQAKEDGKKKNNSWAQGWAVGNYLSEIKWLVSQTGAQSILDYGCGKGMQYSHGLVVENHIRFYPSIESYWDVKINLWEPGYAPLSAFPTEKSDGVICIDVLEHIAEDDVDWVLDEIFSLSKKFVFMNIANYKAKKLFPNGENVHVTVKPKEFWEEKIKKISKNHSNIIYYIIVTSKKDKIPYQEYITNSDAFSGNKISLINRSFFSLIVYYKKLFFTFLRKIKRKII